MPGHTTPDLVFVAIRDQARTVAGVADSRIYICAEPRIDNTTYRCVQIIPGLPISKHPRSGVGLVEEEFDVVCWSRNDLDETFKDDVRFTDSTDGLYPLAESIRATLHQFAHSTITIPVHYLRSSRIRPDFANPEWVSITDTYRVGYELDVGVA